MTEVAAGAVDDAAGSDTDGKGAAESADCTDHWTGREDGAIEPEPEPEPEPGPETDAEVALW